MAFARAINCLFLKKPNHASCRTVRVSTESDVYQSSAGGHLRELFLTFDVEDFISDNSIWILQRILEDLKRYNLISLFFITGHMAEKLQNFPAIVDLLGDHMIGYHSSSHSVHPTIFEFTDIADYQTAYEISLQRETAHINPVCGRIEGRGGILALKSLFPRKDIKAFRAPGNCWSPPHLECLRDLGIEYDFQCKSSCHASRL